MRIAILDDYQKAALRLADWSNLLRRAEITVFDRYLGGEEQVVAALQPFEIVVAMRERTAFPRSVIERLPRLKLIASTGPWNAAIDLAAAADCNVKVSGTGGLRHPTAELTWGLIIALTRRLKTEFAAMEGGHWQTTLGIDLHGKTLGVLGLGDLGSRVARIAVAFGMQVIAWSQNLTDDRANAVGARRVDKHTLFVESDVLSLHTVLSPRTRGIVGADELARMKPTAYLVNTSRGPLVDEAALVTALRENRLAGAAIDTFATEPLAADHPFRSLSNIILTPHIGYVTEESLGLMYRDVVDQIQKFVAGDAIKELKFLV